MRLIEVELWNICQHRHVLFTPDHGLTAVVGPNGSGKSNMLAAIYAGITGDFSRFVTNRLGVCSQYAKRKEKSGIRVKVEHHGTIAEFERMLRPHSTRSFTLSGCEPITSDKAIAKEVEKWFGLPLKIVGQYIFVAQGEMFSILNSGPAERAKDLQKLFGIDKAEHCREAAGKRLNMLDAKHSSFSPTLENSLRADLVTERSKLRDLNAKLLAVKSKLPTEAERAKWKANTEGWPRQQQLDKDISTYTIEFTASKTATERLAELTESKTKQSKLLEKLVKQRLMFAKRAKVVLAEWALYEKQITHLNRWREQQQDTALKLEKLVEPTYENTDADTIDGLKQQLSDVNSRQRELSKALKLFDDYGLVNCPTCLTPVSALNESLAAFRAEVLNLQQESSRLLKECNEAVKRKFEWDKYLRERSTLRDMLDAISQTINNAGSDIIKPIRPADYCKKVVADYEQLKSEYDVCKQDLSKLTAQLSVASTKMASTSATLDRLSDERSKLNLTFADFKSAQDSINAVYSIVQEASSLETEVSLVKRAVTDLEFRLEEAARRRKDSALYANWSNSLSAARNVLHHEALPKLIIQGHLSKLEVQMNKALSDLGADFTVKCAEGFTFDVKFQDGRSLQAEALSGGEKVIFAIAWRLAVNSEFAGDIGLLCLDEPTVWLDRDRLDCLKTAIDKIKVMSKSRGLQCIIITHAEELMPLFDSVITLKTPTGSVSKQ